MLRIILITVTTQNAYGVHAMMLMLTLFTVVTHLVLTTAL